MSNPTNNMPPFPAPSELARHWTLDPKVVFLNHGSFGATPRVVQQAQTRYREWLEREPIDFYINHHQALMDKAREAISGVVGAPWDSIAPVPNATIGVATALAALKLEHGDELLTNNHEYPACQNNLRAVAARAGARVVEVEVPFPITDPGQVVDAVLGGVTSRTRVALLSHVTSPTALILPVEQLVPELEKRGVLTLIDGAHAPGMIPDLNLTRLNPTFYTANCHKWLCSPKGSAFLYVSPFQQASVRPVVLSNNAEKPRPGRTQFLTEFDFVGTQDYSSVFAIPDALEALAAISEGTVADIARRNHALVLKGRDILCGALDIRPTAPDAMVGSICTVILPPHEASRWERLKQRSTRYHDALQDALLQKHRIQVPVWGLPGKLDRFLRISAQLYNTPAQYEYLAAAVKQELEIERAL